MTLYLSDAVRNAMLDAHEAVIGASAKVRTYNGTPPADESAALSGNTMLVEHALAADWASAASGGSKALTGTPISGTAAASGFASFYRIYDAAGTTAHEQGLVAQNWAASTAYQVGQQVTNDSGKCYRCTGAGTSAGSGGPTGTGSGITDGSVTWNYVGTTDMTIDNTNIAASQNVRITSWSKTAPH